MPTMGYLHAGHMSLVARARRSVGPKGKVVLSVYVNPTQFGPGEDFGRYPRNLARDRKICLEHGVDVFFAPTDGEMYPDLSSGGYSTFVREEQLSQRMEGTSRPTHFGGVTTVVAKLFNIVLPEVAVFGAKDYQQAAVVTKMCRDLLFPVQIVVAPTKREADGLAMSSRNKFLSPPERQQAVVLWESIREARRLVEDSKSALKAADLRKKLSRIISSADSARLDYIEFFDPRTLEPTELVKRGSHLALAVFIGKTRLIDNGRI